MGCGAPEAEATAMMSHDPSGHCFFVNQPHSQNETDSAIRALWSSCCHAVRYAGTERAILTRINGIGCKDTCDAEKLPGLSKVVRDRVSFTYRDAGGADGSNVKAIIQFLAESLVTHMNSGVSRVSIGELAGSLVFTWGSPGFLHSIGLRVKHTSQGRWMGLIEDNEVATLGIAIQVDKALQSSDLFEEVRWHTQGEGPSELHPY